MRYECMDMWNEWIYDHIIQSIIKVKGCGDLCNSVEFSSPNWVCKICKITSISLLYWLPSCLMCYNNGNSVPRVSYQDGNLVKNNGNIEVKWWTHLARKRIKSLVRIYDTFLWSQYYKDCLCFPIQLRQWDDTKKVCWLQSIKASGKFHCMKNIWWEAQVICFRPLQC